MYHAKQKGSRTNSLPAINMTCAAAVLLICGGCGSSSSSGGGASAPSPVATYVARNDPLASYFSTIANFQDQDSFTFSETSSSIYTPDPGHFSQGAQTTTSTTQLFDGPFDESGDIIFYHKVNLSQTTIALPKSGAIQVTQETQYEPNAAHPDTYPESYSYFTLSSDGLTKTFYGSDGVSDGAKRIGSRFDPGIVIPLALAAGSSFSETYTEYDTAYIDYFSDEVEGVTSYDVTATFSFKILPSLTVPAGTFTNVGELQLTKSYTLPVGYAGNLTSTPVLDTEVFDLSESAGILQLKSTVVMQDVMVALNPEFANVPLTNTSSNLQQLTSATIAGKQYRGGKAAPSEHSVPAREDARRR